MHECPGLQLREFRHFIWYTGTLLFPALCVICGSVVRAFPRSSVCSFMPKAEACLKEQCMSKRLDGYLFHRSANEHQKPLLQMLDTPKPGHLTILSDWKELFTLLVRCAKTGEEFYANARMEISIFGYVLSERAASGSGEVVVTHVLILSPILAHTSARTCQCVDIAIKQRKGGKVDTIDSISDSGPHFRAYENAWYNCIQMPALYKAQVRTHWGVEKYMKSAADRLFSLFETYLKIARARKIDIVEVEDLRDVLLRINSEQKQRDPTAPNLVVLVDKDSKKVPSAERFELLAPNFSISKTYCISSTPITYHSRCGVNVCDRVFSSMVSANDLTSEMYLQKVVDDGKDYRCGFWDASGRSRWDTNPTPLDRNEENILSRRMAKHVQLLPDGADGSFGRLDLDSLVAAKKERRERQRELLDVQLESSFASSYSSSSSSSSSDSA